MLRKKHVIRCMGKPEKIICACGLFTFQSASMPIKAIIAFVETHAKDFVWVGKETGKVTKVNFARTGQER